MVCSMCNCILQEAAKPHTEMSGPEYEESEINEITKLTRRARVGEGEGGDRLRGAILLIVSNRRDILASAKCE